MSWDPSEVGDGWKTPLFVRPGKGQYGTWGLCASGVCVEWKNVVAQLPGDILDWFWDDDGGVLKVSIDYAQGPEPRGPHGRWWESATPDYDFHFWTNTQRLGLHPDSGGMLSPKWEVSDEAFAPAGSEHDAKFHDEKRDDQRSKAAPVTRFFWSS